MYIASFDAVPMQCARAPTGWRRTCPFQRPTFVPTPAPSMTKVAQLSGA